MKDLRKTKINLKKEQLYLFKMKKALASKSDVVLTSDKTKIFLRHVDTNITVSDDLILKRFTNNFKDLEITDLMIETDLRYLLKLLKIAVDDFKNDFINKYEDFMSLNLELYNLNKQADIAEYLVCLNNEKISQDLLNLVALKLSKVLKINNYVDLNNLLVVKSCLETETELYVKNIDITDNDFSDRYEETYNKYFKQYLQRSLKELFYSIYSV